MADSTEVVTTLQLLNFLAEVLLAYGNLPIFGYYFESSADDKPMIWRNMRIEDAWESFEEGKEPVKPKRIIIGH